MHQFIMGQKKSFKWHSNRWHLKEFVWDDHIKVKFILLVEETKLTYFLQFVSLLQVYINIIPVTGIISRLFWIENKELEKIWTPSKFPKTSSKAQRGSVTMSMFCFTIFNFTGYNIKTSSLYPLNQHLRKGCVITKMTKGRMILFHWSWKSFCFLTPCF